MSQPQAMRVTFHMEGPWVETDMPIHLDDILAAMRVAKEREVSGEALDPSTCNHDLPLERHVASTGEWVFKASMLIAADRIERINWMQTSRIDLEHLSTFRESGFVPVRANKINQSGGVFKTELNHLPITYSSALYGYAVGDVQLVRELLTRCKYIGPARNLGFGTVLSIDVEAVEASQCPWQHRHMPVDGEVPEGCATVHGGIQPPYWERKRHGMISVPIDRDNPILP